METSTHAVRDEHTPTPWKVDPETGFVCTSVQNIAEMIPDTVSDAEIAANARRIVACVNAMKDIPTENIEAGALKELWNALRPLVQIGRDEPDYGKYSVPEAIIDRIVNAVLGLMTKGGA